MPKIIIVEDDPMISEIYQKKFSESGYEVLAADCGEKALELDRTEKADIMLLDLIMPKMDGFEVIKNIRESNCNPGMKIFVFSNLSQKEDQDKAMKLGADGFIIKANYAPSDLVKEISRRMNQDREMEKNEASHNGDSQLSAEKEKNGKKKILLIEDEEIFLEMFGEKLRQDGYVVETANNGAWGLKEALSKDFNLFIIDMMMPAMTGDEIIEKLKLEEKTKDIPIIILSASVEDHVEEKVKKLGANEFFIKTKIIPSELSKKVGELLGE
ncbi:MAG TPA: response regulator [Candidatus Moranbacteria bacterium]|nr:response regulator [Candidatus Moranbacteria bacterium]